MTERERERETFGGTLVIERDSKRERQIQMTAIEREGARTNTGDLRRQGDTLITKEKRIKP